MINSQSYLHRRDDPRGRAKSWVERSTGPTYRYAAYGMQVHSSLECPGLSRSSPAWSSGLDSDPISLRTGAVDRISDPDRAENWYRDGHGDVTLQFQGISRIVVRDGRTIVVDGDPESADSVLRTYVYGMAFGAALHQREALTLHASAVESGDGAAAFLGAKGAGKSTMAAVLCMSGFDLLTDDVLRVDRVDERPVVRPGYGHVKLWPETWRRLVAEETSSENRNVPHGEKRLWTPRSSRPLSRPRLRAIYLIEDGPAVNIESVSGRSAFLALTCHSYTLPLVRDGLEDRWHFEARVSLANTVPAFRLRRPRRLERATETGRRVRDHFRHVCSSEEPSRASAV